MSGVRVADNYTIVHPFPVDEIEISLFIVMLVCILVITIINPFPIDKIQISLFIMMLVCILVITIINPFPIDEIKIPPPS